MCLDLLTSMHNEDKPQDVWDSWETLTDLLGKSTLLPKIWKENKTKINSWNKLYKVLMNINYSHLNLSLIEFLFVVIEDRMFVLCFHNMTRINGKTSIKLNLKY